MENLDLTAVARLGLILAHLLAFAAAFAAVAFGSKNPFEGSNVAPLSGMSEFTAVMRSQSEASVFFIYDSADVNCLRTIPQFTKAAAPLRGFASFYAIDIRDATVNWALDAWNVQILPAVRGASSHRTKRPGFKTANSPSP